MRLYNTMTKTIEDFLPLKDKKVKMFVCGPTVYDYAHLGHAKTYIQMDTLARTLKQLGYDVFYLQNITDLDDKIIQRASEQGVSWEGLRSKFEDEYIKDTRALGIKSVTQYARATDYMENIINQVQVLIDKSFAYTIDDGVYFEVSKFKNYGKLSGRQDIKEDDAQTRIDQSNSKRGWNDFCLWKFSKPDEPVWDAPFGKGRPGWHIEDTAITEHYFGPQYDIHGGAVDLIFPHHEAEIAQMESASGKEPFVKYWVHSGFLNTNQAKMSKSKKNFFTIREVLEKGVDSAALRLFFLQTHYRSPIEFSWENLEAAQNRLRELQAWADLRHQLSAIEMTDELNELFHDTKAGIISALEDDLNTPTALAVLSKLVNYMQNIPFPRTTNKYANEFLALLDDIFGLELSHRPDISDNQKRLIHEREAARQTKDWAKSDTIRKQLKDQSIDILDSTHGAIWRRV